MSAAAVANGGGVAAGSLVAGLQSVGKNEWMNEWKKDSEEPSNVFFQWHNRADAGPILDSITWKKKTFFFVFFYLQRKKASLKEFLQNKTILLSRDGHFVRWHSAETPHSHIQVTYCCQFGKKYNNLPYSVTQYFLVDWNSFRSLCFICMYFFLNFFRCSWPVCSLWCSGSRSWSSCWICDFIFHPKVIITTFPLTQQTLLKLTIRMLKCLYTTLKMNILFYLALYLNCFLFVGFSN